MAETREEDRSKLCRGLEKISISFDSAAYWWFSTTTVIFFSPRLYEVLFSRGQLSDFFVTLLFFAPLGLLLGILLLVPTCQLRGCYHFLLSLCIVSYTSFSNIYEGPSEEQLEKLPLSLENPSLFALGQFISSLEVHCFFMAFLLFFLAIGVTWLILDDPEENQTVPGGRNGSAPKSWWENPIQSAWRIFFGKGTPPFANTNGDEETIKPIVDKIRNDQFVRTLMSESAIHRFASVTFFFALFLSVTYLIGLTFAFHDETQKHRFEPCQPPPTDAGAGGEGADSTAPSGSNPPSNGNAGTKSSDCSQISPVGLFYKKPNFNGIKRGILGGPNSENEKDEGGGENRETKPRSDQSWTVQFSESSARIEEDLRLTSDKSNNDSLGEIAIHLCSSERYRVRLIGYATLRPVRQPTSLAERGAYRSNYDLARARAFNVKNEILSRMERLKDSQGNLCSFSAGRGQEIEWHIATSLGQDSAQGPATQGRTAVEVFVASSRQQDESRNEESVNAASFDIPAEMVLLDYLYFTVYTITTTGYGDIVPVTPFAKFVVSVTNIFEGAFLVIFFNVIVSRRR